MPDVITMIQTNLPPKTTITFHTTIEAQFRAADFYEGSIATVVGPNGTVVVERSGESRLESPEDNVRTFAQFRELFPAGILPDDDSPFTAHVSTMVDPAESVWTWVNNAWFSLYHDDNPDDDIANDVFEAIDAAITLASIVPATVPAAPSAAHADLTPANPSTTVTLWTLTVTDPNRAQAVSSVFYTEAEVTEFLRDNYADGDDVSDENLEEFLVSQGVYWSVDQSQMNTALMSNRS